MDSFHDIRQQVNVLKSLDLVTSDRRTPPPPPREPDGTPQFDPYACIRESGFRPVPIGRLVLVVRYGAMKWDEKTAQEYKFYKDVFGDLLRTHLTVVIVACPVGKLQRDVREEWGPKFDDGILDILRRVKELFGLDLDTKLHHECLEFLHYNDPAERDNCFLVRRSILRSALLTTGARLSKTTVPKTPRMRRYDEQRAHGLRERLAGVTAGVRGVDQAVAANVAAKTAALEIRAIAQGRLRAAEVDLESLDTPELVEIAAEILRSSASFFSLARVNVSLGRPGVPIEEDRFSGEDEHKKVVEWKVQELCRWKGEVHQWWWLQSLDCRVAVLGQKRHLHADKIKQLQQDIQEQKERIRSSEDELRVNTVLEEMGRQSCDSLLQEQKELVESLAKVQSSDLAIEGDELDKYLNEMVVHERSTAAAVAAGGWNRESAIPPIGDALGGSARENAPATTPADGAADDASPPRAKGDTGGS